MKHAHIIKTSLLAMVLAGSAKAGVFIVGGHINAEGVPVVTNGVESFDISYSSTHIAVTNAKAFVTVSQDFSVQATNKTALLAVVVLPADAEKHSIKVTITGQSMRHILLDQDHAQTFLRTAVRTLKNEALLTAGGGKLAVIPLKASHRMFRAALSYSMPATTQQGVLRLRAPMPAAALTRHPVRRAVLTVDIDSELPLRGIFSPTHEASISHPSLRRGKVHLSVDGLRDPTPFELIAIADDKPFGWRTFVHRPTTDEDGFFLVAGCPSGKGESIGPRDYVFAVDTSGSMRGEKMAQARAALEHCLEQLGAQDRFNIITFADSIARFRSDLTPATPAQREAAREFIDELTPAGMTNIDEALTAAVEGKPSDRPRMVIFLTDGTPTVGQRNPNTILSRMQTNNVTDARVFALGIGHEINTFLLDSVAEKTGGESTYVDPEEDLDDKVATLFNRLQYPVLLDAVASFPDLEVHDLTPQDVPDVFRNSLIMLAGRFKKGGNGTLKLTGQKDGTPITLRVPITLPEDTAEDNAYIATVWAARRIGEAVEHIRLHGETDALVEKVVSLSRRYGVMTEYTAIIDSDEADDLSDRDLAQLAKKKMQRARQVHSGKWAVMQSRNDKGLKGRVSSAQSANTFINAQGETQQADNIRQVGSTAYYFRKGVWAPAEDGRKRENREITRFSAEYFELVQENKDFARAASLGKSITINVGDEQFTVK